MIWFILSISSTVNTPIFYTDHTNTPLYLTTSEESARAKVVLSRMKEQENEIAKLKSLVSGMGETLRDLKKATTLWEKADKMGFMGIEAEKK